MKPEVYRSPARLSYRTVRLEGGLLSYGLLNRLMAGSLPGQNPRDFGIIEPETVADVAARIYRTSRNLWCSFRGHLEELPDDDPAISITQERWVIPFLKMLGYELYPNPHGYEVNGIRYAITHRAGKNGDAPPVHIVSARQKLGQVDPASRPCLSPHSLLQGFLNAGGSLWGVVTNGFTIRLLRQSGFMHQPQYVEFDLETIFETGGESAFEDFVLLYRLLHRTRLPEGAADARECWLERYHREAILQRNRTRDWLRDGVERCVLKLGNGFLRRNGDWNGSPQEFYQDLLRLVYRFLFLLMAEDRGLLEGNSLYREHFSIGRLRQLIDWRKIRADTGGIQPAGHDDIWRSLQALWRLLREPILQEDGQPITKLLQIPVLDGGLFAPVSLENMSISNRDLLEALFDLFYFYDDEMRSLVQVNYADLNVEDLGYIYENLLDNHPVIDDGNFLFQQGTERKSTGSYYTPPELVQELIRSALEPVLQERLRGAVTREEQEQAILSIRVIDPAAGSGYFLLAAARRLGRELARVRTGEEEPSPEAWRDAIRDVIARCLYGVDRNPMAVELCRVALWIESSVPEKPLVFLDHHIRCGDSLVGVWDLRVLERGVPDEAYRPVEGDDPEVSASARERNRKERGGQMKLGMLDGVVDNLKESMGIIGMLREIANDTADDCREKALRYWRAVENQKMIRLAMDLWTAAFFQKFRSDLPVITTDVIRQVLMGKKAVDPVSRLAEHLSLRLRFFHWPLEFPEELLVDGGFDVVLCNPPWERIHIRQDEFFAPRDPRIARALNKASRDALIRRLREENPALWEEYHQALQDASTLSRYLRASGRFPLTARGDINVYAVFSELCTHLVRPDGRVGIIVPTGIATDVTNQHFFRHLVESGRLVSLYDFDNRARIFPAVIAAQKFTLLTLRGRGDHQAPAEFAFFCHTPEDLRREEKVLTLSPEDLMLLNPNTLTCPVFRTRQDAELTKAIYRRVPVLVNERTGENPWGVRFLEMFHMASDSHLFRTREDLERDGYRRVGNRFVCPVSGPDDPPSSFVGGWNRGVGRIYLPVYEARMIWHYDHRFGTYEDVRSRSDTHLPTPGEAEHASPAFFVQPYYWVPAEVVEDRLNSWPHDWLLGFRDVCRSTDERTAIFSLLPRVGVVDTAALLVAENATVHQYCLLIANLNSIVLDWIVRQKIGGAHLSLFILRQLPVLPPAVFTPEDMRFIVPRVLELVYTAWDLAAFAAEVWESADPELKEALQAQWEENRDATGGNPWDTFPEDWEWAYPDIAKHRRITPFKWDEARRARLRAELDACYARLYGLTRKQLRYILDPADLTGRELADILDPWEEVHDPLDPAGYEARVQASTFPGETFRLLKKKELRQYGEYRTRRLILEAWERMFGRG